MQAAIKDSYDLVIVGAGPAGLSAAARAAEIDREAGLQQPSYVLLESADAIAQTIQAYQVGKHVMDEPSFLNLRSPIGFSAGKREDVLMRWDTDVDAQNLNIRYACEVTEVSGVKGDFEVRLANGGSIIAGAVIVAAGTQGNLRHIGVTHDEPSEFVCYSLADPRIINDKHVIVIGAGDSAIENALALQERNNVYIVNRRSEFSRAKSGNLNAVLGSINDARSTLDCYYDSSVKSISPPERSGEMGEVTLTTATGEVSIACHLVIARLGSTPPRARLERMGLSFSSPLPTALPDLDKRYQASVPGIYVVGGLSGYPLIKQAMNQGQDVVDFIAGNDVEPADHELLVARLGGLYPEKTVDETLDFFCSRGALFESVSPIGFRELMIESRLAISGSWARGESGRDYIDGAPTAIAGGHHILDAGDFVEKFYVVMEGNLKIRPYPGAPWSQVGVGQFFGESCLFAGRSQDASVRMGDDCVVIQIPRRILIKLALSNTAVRKQLDDAFVFNLLKVTFKPKIEDDQLRLIAGDCPTKVFEAGNRLFEEGDHGDVLYVLRAGTVNLLQGLQQQLVADQYAGELVGQLSLMGHPRRMYSALAMTRAECVEIDGQKFRALLSGNPEIRAALEKDLTVLLQETNTLYTHRASAAAMNFLMQNGLGEATDALIIDSSKCVGCDQCEVACASTHGGVSRLKRAQGPSLGRFHIPTACRHCETPHCMKDCPPDAIRRTQTGAVYIQDNCIGCGNCEANCPYGAIDLVAMSNQKNGLWKQLVTATQRFLPSNDIAPQEVPAIKLAVKCDACTTVAGGPACVRACPTGAALRLGSGELLEMIGE